VATVGACGDSTGPQTVELVRNRAKWEARGPEAYTFEYHRSCGECLPEWVRPVRISVDGGVVTAVVLAATSEPVDPPDFRFTIDSLFAQVERTIAQRPYRLTVEYDPALGYPRSMAVDLDRTAVDDEGGFGAHLVSTP
jgi:hypothetical protein